MSSPDIRLHTIYAEPSAGEGKRILVDRIWPRGMSKEKAHIDLWLKEVAPSTELRKWFGHVPERWDEFQKRYAAELAANPAPLDRLVALASAGPITLVYSARDEEHNQAVAFRAILESRF